jgi:4-hydroxy-4-methyl-2-oxoglutarate aldolase
MATMTSGTVALRGELGTGIVTDAFARLGLEGAMDGVLPLQTNPRVVGPAVTVRYAPKRGADRLDVTLYELIRTCQRGNVLVIGAGGTRTSVFGGNIARCGELHGLAAIVTDGHCRDRDDMMALSMPVFCAGPTVRLPTDIEITGHNVPITCGGAQVNPGDLVVADIDGVMIVPSGRLDSVLHQIEELTELEAALDKAIRSQAPMAEIQAILKRKKALRA